MKKHSEKNRQSIDAADLQKFSSFNKGRFNSGFDSGPRELHKAKCADCGADCDVPFKPREGRPVYCRACFPKHKPPQRF